MRFRVHPRDLGIAAVIGMLTSCADPAIAPTTSNMPNPPDQKASSNKAANSKPPAGAVYSMSNQQAGNTIVMYDRADDGTLSNRREFPTGGTESGGFEDSSNGLVLGTAEREASPNNFVGAAKLLFATNAGSNTISVFQLTKDGLELVETQNSGGEKPVSLTVSHGVLYVLNSGEFVDGEIAIPNCTTGNLPSITGFRMSGSGQLTPIPNSTRQLSGDHRSGCAQVSFNPSGKVLVVTERLAGDEDPTGPAGDEGIINTYALNSDDTPGTHRQYDATGEGPFGFTFDKSGALLTTEQFDGPIGPGRGAAAGYASRNDGTLTPTSPSVHNGGTDSCWFIVTDNGKYGYVSSFFGTGQISSYRVRHDGGLELIDATDDDGHAATGASDLALSRNSEFLYQVNSLTGKINVYHSEHDGGLTFLQSVQAHAPSATAAFARNVGVLTHTAKAGRRTRLWLRPTKDAFLRHDSIEEMTVAETGRAVRVRGLRIDPSDSGRAAGR